LRLYCEWALLVTSLSFSAGGFQLEYKLPGRTFQYAIWANSSTMCEVQQAAIFVTRGFAEKIYSCLSDSMGSTWAAWMAGYNPKTMPIVMLMDSGSRTPDSVMSVIMPEK